MSTLASVTNSKRHTRYVMRSGFSRAHVAGCTLEPNGSLAKGLLQGSSARENVTSAHANTYEHTTRLTYTSTRAPT